MNRKSALKLARLATTEAKRATLGLRKPGFPKLFYLSYLIRDLDLFEVEARYGALYKNERYQRRNCLADARVGSYRRDQVTDGGLFDNSDEDESYGYVELPISDRSDPMRIGLWRLTDAKYREAEEAFLRKRAHELTYLDTCEHLAAWQKSAALQAQNPVDLPPIDHEYWADYVEKASATLLDFPRIRNSHVELKVRHQTNIFVNSDGSVSIESLAYWQLNAYLWYLSDKGDGIPWTVNHFTPHPDQLPDLNSFRREIRAAARQLEKIAAAPKIHSYSGPVLLEPVAAGLLIHEALGHRLEGNRLRATGEAKTFADALGNRVLPDFLTLHDDPTQASWVDSNDREHGLVGHYQFDDEGTPAADARLIEAGKLTGFLTGKIPVNKRHRSNGHARSRRHERSMSRMGVTILEASNGLDPKSLRKQLIDQIKQQGLPYGIRIIDATGGETATDSYDFQAFLGEVNLASRIYPDGREELVRGINFIGTPLNAVHGIIAAGDQPVLDNGWCGAESGFVPVSTISPSLLVRHLELQSKSETPYTQYCYPMPSRK
ncbi:MAG: metallopeptidase TldD-related protein [Planctomycetota bacterium]|nr:metallopeptidase TldD-related protein [Planctomycetota bacterium]